MSALCSAQVISNANDKLCRATLIIDDTACPPTVRMERLARMVDEYRAGTAGTVERLRAVKAAKQYSF